MPDQIVTAAGSDRHDDFYRAVGIAALRLRRGHPERERCEHSGDPWPQTAKFSHRHPPNKSAFDRLFFQADYATWRGRRQRMSRITPATMEIRRAVT
jgi:hypothetical protein